MASLAPKVKGYAGFARAMLKWYERHQRELPWRATANSKPNPYHVWLSEIMLQQTMVATVIPYFHKFVKTWPNLTALAAAPRDKVLAAWAGLGYYRRAHLMHDCARQLVADHAGRLPETEVELLALPGFGAYTAAAVAAIAFGKTANVVDGNVERIMARLFAVETPLPKAKKELKALALGLLPSRHCGDYAQALMDLGATLCRPRNPLCHACPVSRFCKAFRTGQAEALPKRAAKTLRAVKRAIAFLAINSKGQIFVRQRKPQGLLGGMLEVPSTAWEAGDWPSLAKAKKNLRLKGRWRLRPDSVKHVFSHFELHVKVAVATISDMGIEGQWLQRRQMARAAIPSLMRKIVLFAYEQ